MNLQFLLPKPFDSDPGVPLGPPARDIDRLLLEERARAEAYFNLVRIGTAAASVIAVLVWSPASVAPPLDRVRLLVLAAFFAWATAQHLLVHRKGRVLHWLMRANAFVDVTVVSALVAAWGAMGEVGPAGPFDAPEFFGYFVVLAFRPVTLSSRTAAVVGSVAVLQYLAILVGMVAAGRLVFAEAGVTAPGVPWWQFETIKLIILTAAGGVIAVAAGWYERVIRQALKRQATIEDRLLETVHSLERNVSHLSEAQQALRESEERYREVNRELEERVTRRTEQLQVANRELEAFSYSVSHDLRAPLRAIKGFSSVIAEEDADEMSPEAKRLLGLVQHNATRMGSLIDSLLQFARLSRQPLSKTNVNMNDMVHGVVASMEAEMDERDIVFSVTPLPPCEADPLLMTQVFTNLISNAVKFTRGRSDAEIDIGSNDETGETVYFVRDNGVGFNMEYSDRLFAVFQRLHSEEEFEGTGVGLALVQRIVERHGGRIWAEAEPQRGACFYFTV